MLKRPNSGMTIIEILIALGLASILIMVITSSMQIIARMQKSTLQRLEKTQLTDNVQMMLRNDSICSCMLANQTFDSTQPSSNISVQPAGGVLKAGCGVSDPILAQIGQVIPGSQTELTVKDIQVRDIQPFGSPGTFRGQMTITFDQSVFPIQSVMWFQASTTNPNSPTAAKITNCVVNVASGAGNFDPANMSCPAGHVMTGLTPTNVICTPLSTSAINPSGATPTSPGPGCTSSYCSTNDFGPCTGSYCRTNGKTCSGDYCSACGSGGSCTGAYCCNGPGCPGC